MSVGYIYCFSNESMPGILKCGMTSRTPLERLKEANLPNTWKPPTQYQIEFAKKVANPLQKEKQLHKLLEQFSERVNQHREHFRISVEQLRVVFDFMDGEMWIDERAINIAVCETLGDIIDTIVEQSEKQGEKIKTKVSPTPSPTPMPLLRPKPPKKTKMRHTYTSVTFNPNELFCDRCGYHPKIKSHLKRHCFSKKSCESILSDMTQQEVRDKYFKVVNQFKCEAYGCDKYLSSKKVKQEHHKRCKHMIKEIEERDTASIMGKESTSTSLILRT